MTQLPGSSWIEWFLHLVFVLHPILWLAYMCWLAFLFRRLPLLRRRNGLVLRSKGGWTVAGLAISAAAGAYGASQQRKAAKEARNATGQVDPEEVARVAREQARKNIEESAALERQFSPETGALRRGSLNRLRGYSERGDPYGDLSLAAILDSMRDLPEDAEVSPLLQGAFRQAGEDLAMGGTLDTATRNEVTRRGLATAGRVGGGSLGLARSIVPRDLGITSLNLRNQRLQTAGQFGQIQQGVNQQSVDNRTRRSQLRAQLASALQGGANAQAQRYLSLAQFGQTLQPPESGLSPGDIASLYVGNANAGTTAAQNAAALRAAGAQNIASLGGQIGGALTGVAANYGNGTASRAINRPADSATRGYYDSSGQFVYRPLN